MNVYFQRIIHNKLKLGVLIFALLLPLVETVQIIIDVFYWGVPKYNPNYVTFLAGYRGRLAYNIYFWILPVYFLIIASEDAVQDQKTGYRLMMIEREGKKKYVIDKLLGSFLISFMIMMIGILINFIFLHIILNGGKEVIFDTTGTTPAWFFQLCLDHPVMANFLYGIEASLMAGIVGALGTSLSITFRNRKVIYAFALLLWTIMINLRRYNILRAIQPFELDYLSIVLKSFAFFVLVYCSIIVICIGWVMHRDEV